MEIKGKVKEIMQPVEVSENFTRREFVVETEGEYPQPILIQAGSKLDISNLNEGDSVVVSINIRGREWNGKYYNNLQAWKVQGMSQAIKEDKKDLPF